MCGSLTCVYVVLAWLAQQCCNTSIVLLTGWKRMALQILYFVPGNLLNPESSFKALSERLVVSPVLQTLVYSKNPEGARQWVDRVVSGWTFKRVIPAHFDAPVAAGPGDFRYGLNRVMLQRCFTCENCKVWV